MGCGSLLDDFFLSKVYWFRLRCVKYDPLTYIYMAICIASVNGQWTNWSQWSRCSRTCNGGTRSRRRSCTNPPPSNGGAHCSGPGSLSEFCGRIPCQFIGVWILILQLFHLHFFFRGTQREILRKRPKNNSKAWMKFSETILSILGDCWKKIICSSLPARLMKKFPASNLTTCNLTYWEVS